jgi:tRNA-binding protein
MSPLKPQITYDDFARLDIRIGKVVEVQPFPRARNPSWKVGVKARCSGTPSSG